jgi:7,8-dihydro-6-hydroxymethylpterin-pyrophosphokinase
MVKPVANLVLYFTYNAYKDILLYDDNIINQDNEMLVVPHPRLHERTFVLKPLCEYYIEFIYLKILGTFQHTFLLYDFL